MVEANEAMIHAFDFIYVGEGNGLFVAVLAWGVRIWETEKNVGVICEW